MLAEDAGDAAGAAHPRVMPASARASAAWPPKPMKTTGVPRAATRWRSTATSTGRHSGRWPRTWCGSPSTCEAAEREGRIEEEHALPHPAVGDLRRRLEIDAAGLDVGDQPLPVRDRAGVAGIAGAGRGDQLHPGPDALREHLLEFAPLRDVAGLEGAAGGEGGAGIGVLPEDDDPHVLRARCRRRRGRCGRPSARRDRCARGAAGIPAPRPRARARGRCGRSRARRRPIAACHAGSRSSRQPARISRIA